MSGRLQKVAISMEYFLRKDMTPDDKVVLNKMLDEQGLPPVKNMQGAEAAAAAPSKMSKVVSHLKRHKGKYGLGAAALLGAAMLSRRSSQPEMQQMEMPPEQSGF